MLWAGSRKGEEKVRGEKSLTREGRREHCWLREGREGKAPEGRGEKEKPWKRKRKVEKRSVEREKGT